jgi:hypothetical protein
MNQNNTIVQIDADKLRAWLVAVSAVLPAIRPPEFFEQMGFTPAFVRSHVDDLMSVWGHGSPGHKIVRGVSDVSFLQSVAEAIGADTSEGDAKLCWTNKILAWREACVSKLDEIIRGLELGRARRARRSSTACRRLR